MKPGLATWPTNQSGLVAGEAGVDGSDGTALVFTNFPKTEGGSQIVTFYWREVPEDFFAFFQGKKSNPYMQAPHPFFDAPLWRTFVHAFLEHILRKRHGLAHGLITTGGAPKLTKI